jgi:hypothetical protein
MGISWSARLVVGLRREDFIDRNLCNEWIENDILSTHASYDADGDDDAVVGTAVAKSGDYSSAVLDPDATQAAIDKAKADFKKLTEQDANVYLVTVGS